MARAKRHFLPGYVWNSTHRCHKRVFTKVCPGSAAVVGVASGGEEAVGHFHSELFGHLEPHPFDCARS